MHQNLATHLLSAVDEIVRLVPIPAITSIVPGSVSLPHSPYSSVDMMPIIKMMPITWWIIQSSQLSWSYLSRSVSSTSHSLMLRYLNTAGKKLSISLKNTISFSNRLKGSSLNCKFFSSLPAAGQAFSGIFLFLFWDEAICQKRWRVHLVTFRMWVTPLLFSSSKLEAFHSLVDYQRYIFYDCRDKSWQKWSAKLIQTTFPRKESQRFSRQGPSAPGSTESPRQWKPAELWVENIYHRSRYNLLVTRENLLVNIDL